MVRDWGGTIVIIVNMDLGGRKGNREAVEAVLRVVLAGMNITEAEDLDLDGARVVVLVEWEALGDQEDIREAQEVFMVGNNEMICRFGCCVGVRD